MPCITVDRDLLFQSLGRKFEDDEFSALCFSFGIELDDISCVDGEMQYKIELPANRCELLCLEGLSHFLGLFIGTLTLPHYKIQGKMQQVIIKKEVTPFRPYCLCATLLNVTFTKTSLKSFVDFQEKLHQNICRKRTLVSVGTHDLDTIVGPFVYTALSPEEIRFRAITLDKEYNGKEMLDIYLNDKNIKQYVPIIKDFSHYPVLFDSKGTVLSLPPIINGFHSRLTTETKNILVECTATDLVRAQVVLKAIVTCFSKYCNPTYTIGPVETVLPCERKQIYPDLSSQKFIINSKWLNDNIGIDVSIATHCLNLKRMGLEVSCPDASGETIHVAVPPNRSDILHKFDILEDAAIAFGYKNIPRRFPLIYTTASLTLLNRFSDMIRAELVAMAYTEGLSFILGSLGNMTAQLNGGEHSPNQELPVMISSSHEQNCVRNSLLPGMLSTIAANLNLPLPIKLFEVSDIVVRSNTNANEAINRRCLCAIYCGTSDGFEFIHGVLDKLMSALGIKPHFQVSEGSGYKLVGNDHSTFFPGRCCEIVVKDSIVGRMGVLHPNVLKNFDVRQAVASAVELNIQKLIAFYNF